MMKKILILLLSIFTLPIQGSCIGVTPVSRTQEINPLQGTVSGKKYVLPPLPYSHNALKPYIDEETLKIHHGKHHQKYVDNLNDVLKDHPELQGKPLDELLRNPQALPESIRAKVINNGGGHYNHTYYWHSMGKNASRTPLANLAEAIKKTYGSFDAFKKQFNEAATSVFGSGWTWLCLDKAGALKITTTPNQDTPLKDNLTPLMCLDEWEHAYYLKYKNDRAAYMEKWWHIVNWDYISQLYEQVKK